MKKPRFSDSQIIAILKQAEGGSPVPELCREHGISYATFYMWRGKFGGMDASLMARLKELAQQSEVRASQAENQVRLLLASRSWKITAPLRAASGFLQRLTRAGKGDFSLGTRMKQWLRARLVPLVHWAAQRVQKSVCLRGYVLRVLHRFPAIEVRLRRMYMESRYAAQMPAPNQLQTQAGQFESPEAAGLDQGGALQGYLRGPHPQGINAGQRSPLEASFLGYWQQR